VAGAVDPAEARLSFRASFPEISMRVVVRGADAEARLERISGRVRERLGPWVIGEGAVTMEQVVGDALRAKGLTLGLAESCTGGLIAHRVTNVPGSSAYFRGGIGAYANDVKTRLLGVSPDTLARHGAVSEETAREMAAGARRALGVDVAAPRRASPARTGHAGEARRPRCFAIATADGTRTSRHQLWGDRSWVKILASQIALDIVRRHVLGLPRTRRSSSAVAEQGARSTYVHDGEAAALVAPFGVACSTMGAGPCVASSPSTSHPTSVRGSRR
jgi:nicotinamide-nucleotide amidase